MTRGSLTIENTEVIGNTAIDNGGGIYRAQLSNLVITDSVISGNTATLGSGGAIYPINSTGVVLNGTNNLCGNTPDDWFGCSSP